MNRSSLILACCVLCFFPEHNVVFASDTPNVEAAALRKKATSLSETFKIKKIFVRSTSFSHNESNEDGEVVADKNSAAFSSKTHVPLVYAESEKIGTAAVSNRDGISFGDLIIVPDGRCFLAVDTGSALKSKKASRELAEKKNIDDPAFKNAPVVDFFSRNETQVGSEWMTVAVVKCPVDFMKLTVAQRKMLLKPEMWQSAIHQKETLLVSK